MEISNLSRWKYILCLLQRRPTTSRQKARVVMMKSIVKRKSGRSKLSARLSHAVSLALFFGSLTKRPTAHVRIASEHIASSHYLGGGYLPA